MTPRDITLAVAPAARTSSDLEDIAKTLMVGIEFAKENSDMDAEYPLDRVVATELMATVRTCALALEAVVASHDTHVREPLWNAMRHNLYQPWDETDES